MKQDQLFLLKPDFQEQGKTYYCPGCAETLGILEYYPALKKEIEIHYVDITRPRPAIIALIGEANQSCPVLILKDVPKDLPPQVKVQQANGHAFVAAAREIGTYLAHVHGFGIPY